jgi:hypothetical protein
MTGNVVKNKGGRPKGSGSPYMQLSVALGKAFDRSVQKVGGIDVVADLLVEQMRDEGKILEVLKVIQGYLPRQHAIGLELSASANLSDALANVQTALSKQRQASGEIIEAEFVETGED